MLCDTCLPIFSHKLPAKKYGWRSSGWLLHHPSMVSLFEASSLKCRLCTELCDELLQVEKGALFAALEYMHTRFQIRFDDGVEQISEPIMSLWLQCRLNVTKAEQEKSELFELEYKIYPTSGVGESGDVDAIKDEEIDMSSQDSNDGIYAWRTLTSWLDHCSTNHNLCRQNDPPQVPAWYPTRLIDVYGGYASRKANSPVRLHVTPDTPTYGRYVTLSHCWGKAPMSLKLTTNNMKDMQNIIPFESLPRTFAEAVQVARRLGVQYIWIDSLCVIQDSAEDWKHESGKMGLVYKHSWLNIAASGSRDSRGGLFFPRKRYTIKPFWVNTNWSFEQPYDDIKKRDLQFPSGGAICYKSVPQRYLNDVELNRRGWVVQERVLSPRQVYFDRKQLFYECRECKSHETIPKSIPKGTTFDDVKKFPVYLYQIHDMNRSNKKQSIKDFDTWIRTEEVYQSWATLLQAYTESALTNGTDKLIAISGLAAEMSEALQTRWLAGLWEARLHSELMWKRHRPIRYARPLRAPSWSWACSDRTFSTSLQSYDCLTQGTLLEANIVNANFGDGIFCQGVLRMSGRLYPASESRLVAREKKFPRDLGWQIEGNLGQTGEGELLSTTMSLDELPEGDWSSNNTYALPLLVDEEALGKNKSARDVFGLLLRVVPDRKDCFERIGLFQVRVDEAQYKIFQDLWSGDAILDDMEHIESAQGQMLVVYLV